MTGRLPDEFRLAASIGSPASVEHQARMEAVRADQREQAARDRELLRQTMARAASIAEAAKGRVPPDLDLITYSRTETGRFLMKRIHIETVVVDRAWKILVNATSSSASATKSDPGGGSSLSLTGLLLCLDGRLAVFRGGAASVDAFREVTLDGMGSTLGGGWGNRCVVFFDEDALPEPANRLSNFTPGSHTMGLSAIDEALADFVVLNDL